jgi:DNA-binding Lrp family transcriptional regulator
MTDLTDLDRRILTTIQGGFPIAPRPYTQLAADFGCTEAEALASVAGMRDSGIIRRVGAIFDSARLGYRSTLCAIASPPERIEEVAAVISAYPNVTHNYQREDRYNVWFTLIAPSQERIAEILGEIAAATGIDDILDLPAIRLFKIKVDFDLTGEKTGRTDAPPATRPAETESVALTADDKALVRLLQDDLEVVERPFAAVAARLREQGVEADEAWVIERTRTWLDTRVIRRFGAAIKHHKTGFSANAMGAWIVPEERVEEAGAIMASFREVSHCYERPTTPTWPNNLYTMIHGRTREECVEVAERIREATGLPEPRLLYSTREFKKTSMRYFAE